MNRPRLSLLTRLLVALAVLAWGADRSSAGAAAQSGKGDKATAPATSGQQTKVTDVAGRVHTIPKRVTQAERQAAADRLKAKAAAAPAAGPQPAAAAAARPHLRSRAPFASTAVPGRAQQAAHPRLLGPDGQLGLQPASDEVRRSAAGVVHQRRQASSSRDCQKYIPVAQPQPSPVGYGGDQRGLLRDRARRVRHLAVPQRDAGDQAAGVQADQRDGSQCRRLQLPGPGDPRPEGQAGAHQVHQQPAHRRGRQSLHSGGHDRHGIRAGTERRRCDAPGDSC